MICLDADLLKTGVGNAAFNTCRRKTLLKLAGNCRLYMYYYITYWFFDFSGRNKLLIR